MVIVAMDWNLVYLDTRRREAKEDSTCVSPSASLSFLPSLLRVLTAAHQDGLGMRGKGGLAGVAHSLCVVLHDSVGVLHELPLLGRGNVVGVREVDVLPVEEHFQVGWAAAL